MPLSTTRLIRLFLAFLFLGLLSGKESRAAIEWSRAETLETYLQMQFLNPSDNLRLESFKTLGMGWGVNVTPHTGGNVYFFGGFPKSIGRFPEDSKKKFFGGGDFTFDFYFSSGRFSPFVSPGLGYVNHAATNEEYLSGHVSLGCTWHSTGARFIKVFYQRKYLVVADGKDPRITGLYVHAGIYMDLDQWIRQTSK